MKSHAKMPTMNVALPKPMSLAEFLEWEEKQKLRYEFDGFQPVARTGGTVGHACIQTNLATSIVGRLRGRPCEFFGSNLKIQVGGDHIRYPDSFVTCSPCNNKSTVHGPCCHLRGFEPDHGEHRPYRQGPRISGDAVRPALCHARAGLRRRHRLCSHRRRMDRSCSTGGRHSFHAGNRRRASCRRALPRSRL